MRRLGLLAVDTRCLRAWRLWTGRRRRRWPVGRDRRLLLLLLLLLLLSWRTRRARSSTRTGWVLVRRGTVRGGTRGYSLWWRGVATKVTWTRNIVAGCRCTRTSKSGLLLKSRSRSGIAGRCLFVGWTRLTRSGTIHLLWGLQTRRCHHTLVLECALLVVGVELENFEHGLRIAGIVLTGDSRLCEEAGPLLGQALGGGSAR